MWLFNALELSVSVKSRNDFVIVSFLLIALPNKPIPEPSIAPGGPKADKPTCAAVIPLSIHLSFVSYFSRAFL
ncbi:hypothetical protein BVZ79_01123 [Haemophilus influenzae]|nr:hypothetical protein BVZ79_01123 [Haemophilus influenzae]